MARRPPSQWLPIAMLRSFMKLASPSCSMTTATLELATANLAAKSTPGIQARGYRDAIDYICSLPEIDKSRVAIWGDSFSAGQVLVVGACDDRVKAIVSQITACGP